MSGSDDQLKTEISYNIDYFTIKRGMVYAHGWVFHPHLEISEIQLCGKTATGENSFTLDVCYPVDRPDVGLRFKNVPSVRQSGFHILGKIDVTQVNEEDLCLAIIFSDQQKCSISLANKSGSDIPSAPKSRIIKYGFIRSFQLLRQGKFAILKNKIKKQLKPLLFLDQNLDAAWPLIQNRQAVFIMDHNLGGGANLYRERLIAEKLDQHTVVVLLTFSPITLAYNVAFRTTEKEVTIALDDIEDILEIAEKCCITSIIYNDAVLFPDAIKVPELLLMLKNMAKGISLTINIHDYFPLCPSPHLLNDQNVYCDLPDQHICEDCLVRSRQPFIGFYGKIDIADWRKKWFQALAVADNICCFSTSSQKLLLRIHHELPKDIIQVKPHDMSYCGFFPLPAVPASPMRIGIVGDINEHKGSKIVNDVAEVIAKKGLPYRILVIGTINEVRYPKVLKQTGSFIHGDLPTILQKNGINISFFPSICPETFSFVVHELIKLQLPIVSFPYGAQGEAVGAYSKGRLLTGTNPEGILNELEEFHRDIYGVKSL